MANTFFKQIDCSNMTDSYPTFSLRMIFDDEIQIKAGYQTEKGVKYNLKTDSNLLISCNKIKSPTASYYQTFRYIWAVIDYGILKIKNSY